MRPAFCLCAVMGCLLVGGALAAVAAAEQGGVKPSEGIAAPRPAVTFSKATTYISGPLRKDGYPDYLAAIDARYREGVTPANNSAVLYLRAVGPGSIPVKERQDYFARLGIDPLPEKGEYFLDLDKHLLRSEERQRTPTNDDLKKVRRHFDEALKRPWSAEEFPQIAAWLGANERPLAILVEASQLPRRYDPLVRGEQDAVFAALLPALGRSRRVTEALVIRSMLRLHEGRVQDAWQDLLACHRLARLAGQGMFLTDANAGIALDQIACDADRVLLEHATGLAREQWATMLKDFDRLPPLPKMADKLGYAERLSHLDFLCLGPSKGLGSLDRLLSQVVTLDANGQGRQFVSWWVSSSFVKCLMDAAAGAAVDWDEVLREANARHDRFVAACRLPSHAERLRAAQRLTAEAYRHQATLKGTTSASFMILGGWPGSLTERADHIFGAFGPPIEGVVENDDLANTRFRLIRLAFASAVYRAEHGSYPAKLTELVPKYVTQMPVDVFCDSDLRYHRTGDGGYLLYSVGVNGKDDGGRRSEDRSKANEPWDDLAIRMADRKQ